MEGDNSTLKGEEMPRVGDNVRSYFRITRFTPYNLYGMSFVGVNDVKRDLLGL